MNLHLILMYYQIGNHLFMCGDIMQAKTWEAFARCLPRKIYLVYSDPPWNPGNEKYWRTHAGIKQPRSHTYVDFVHNFLNIVEKVSPSHLFVEQSVHGKKDYKWYVEQVQKHCLPKFDKAWTCYYGAPVSISDKHETQCRRPNKLLHFGENVLLLNPTGMRGSEMTRHVFSHVGKKGSGVLDPCVGKGMTARMAHETGMTCYGIEINPKRLAVTIKWLEKKLKVEANVVS